MSEITIVVDDDTAKLYAEASPADRARLPAVVRAALRDGAGGGSAFLAELERLQAVIQGDEPVSREEYNALMREIGAEGLVETEDQWRAHAG